MSVKGSWPRPQSVTNEELELRKASLRGNITLRQFTIRFNKLKKRGLIKRDGRIIK